MGSGGVARVLPQAAYNPKIYSNLVKNYWWLDYYAANMTEVPSFAKRPRNRHAFVALLELSQEDRDRLFLWEPITPPPSRLSAP